MNKKEWSIALLLLLLCSYVSWKNPQFLSAYNLQKQIQLIGIYGIFAIGMGIVIITGGIDLSVGSIFALQGVVLSILLVERQWPWTWAALAVILGVVALESFHGLLITKVRLQPFIVTLCGLLIYRGLARYIAGDATKGFGDKDFGWLRPLSMGYFGPPAWVSRCFTAIGNISWLPSMLSHLFTSLGKFRIPTAFEIMLVIAVVMYFVLHRSVYGRYLFAVGRNEEAAKYSGINTKLVVGSAYAVAGILAAISGIIIAFYGNSISPSSHGNAYELYAIAAAVLGGCSLRGGEGSIVGILLGTALIQVLPNFVNLLGIESSLNLAVLGAVILVAVLLDEVLGWRSRRRGLAGAARGSPTVPDAKLASANQPAKSL
jgi:ribose transport system permease protein